MEKGLIVSSYKFPQYDEDMKLVGRNKGADVVKIMISDNTGHNEKKQNFKIQ